MLRKLLHVLPLLLLLSAPCWAQTAGWEFPTASSVTVASADNGKILASDDTPGTFVTVTLPSPSGLPTGWEMGFSTANGHGIVVNPPNSVYIFAGQKQLTSFSAPSNTNYEFFTIQSDGTNYRLLASTATTTLYNGLIGAPGGKLWTYLFSTGYSATAADNGTTITSALTGGATTITLPSTGLIPNGWAVNLYANGQPITLNLNGVSGGSLITPNGGSVTSYVLPGTPTSYALLSFDGASFRVLIAAGGTTNFTVDSVAQLAALGAVTNNTTITTRGHSTPSDGGGGTYTFSSSNCPIPGGDNGSEVQPTTGTGCFIISPQPTGVSMAVWGGKGDGVTNDAAADQAAFAWAASVHGTLQIPANWLSYIGSATLSDNGNGIIIHGNNPTPGHTTDTCTSGFTEVSGGVSANSNMLSLTGSGTKMDHVCLQAGPGSGVAASAGIAVKIGGGQNQQLNDNLVLWPYDGIVGDNASGTNTLIISKNDVIGEANRGYAFGQTPSGTGIVGLRFLDNTSTCYSGAPAPYGVVLYGVAVDHYAGNDIIGCQNNLALIPGVVATKPQIILGFFSDVLGDSATVHNLLIQPQGGTIEYLKFNRWWSGMNNNETGAGILIDQATGGGTVNTLSFVGGVVHGSFTPSAALNLIDIEGTVCGLTINDNQIGSDGSGTTNDNGILYNVSGCGGMPNVINGNNFAGRAGVLASALTVASGVSGPLTFVGNNLSNPTTPIIWDPTAVNTIFDAANNYPGSTNAKNIASAASIVVPPYQDIVYLTGITNVSNISPWWQVRHIRFRIISGLTFSTGGGTGGICTALTASVGEIVDAYWNPNLSCWDLK